MFRPLRHRILMTLGTTAVGFACLFGGSSLALAQAPAPAQQSGPQTVTPQASGPVGLKLPTCIESGNCTVDDIVTTGAAFANLLTQLSAAAFFATFIYGGAMYLLSFGDKARVDKGKKALTGAAIGMLFVLIAWTLVNYIANSLTGRI